jgi:pilus assembly protein Flp/PilA
VIQSQQKKQDCFELKLRRNTVKDKVMKFLQEEDGLTIVEYAVAAGLITATVAGAFFALGGTIEGIIKLLDGYLKNPAG